MGYKILHIVGNTDGEVTIPGMWKWVKDRKLPVTQPWSVYLTPTGDHLGYQKSFGNLTVLTVSGTGKDVLYAKATDITRIVRRFT